MECVLLKMHMIDTIEMNKKDSLNDEGLVQERIITEAVQELIYKVVQQHLPLRGKNGRKY